MLRAGHPQRYLHRMPVIDARNSGCIPRCSVAHGRDPLCAAQRTELQRTRTGSGDTIREFRSRSKGIFPSLQLEAHVFFSLSSVHICPPSHDALTITDHHRGASRDESYNP
jgi:hypothetical protein